MAVDELAPDSKANIERIEQANETGLDQDSPFVTYHSLPSTPFEHKAAQTTWQVSQQETHFLNAQSCVPYGMETSATIRASISKGTCDWRCRCQCHPRQTRESPRWLTALVGTLFYGHTGTPLLRLRPCNFAGCIQREALSCQLTYHFPRWTMKRAFTLSISYKDLVGLSASWSIGFPGTISASHNAWQCIERHQPQEFLKLLRDRQISSNNMADDDGTSLLLVCLKSTDEKFVSAKMALQYALKFRSHDIIRLLLDYNANPHLVDPRGMQVSSILGLN